MIAAENLTKTFRDRKRGLVRAVTDVSFRCQPGEIFGLLGANGAGKTTTLKCLLNLLQPESGQVELFGRPASIEDVNLKARFPYVPDTVGFYPWMNVTQWFDYLASFRRHWNDSLQHDLLDRFNLSRDQKVVTMSKGQKMQIALIGALCPEPELLILDEPTSGLDPLVRREFIETVIGAYQEGDPEKRTVLVSTHLITEFEGLIDEFTIIDQGRDLITMNADDARQRYQKVRARFPLPPDKEARFPCISQKGNGREFEFIVNGQLDSLTTSIRNHQGELQSQESLSLEEVFIAALKAEEQA